MCDRILSSSIGVPLVLVSVHDLTPTEVGVVLLPGAIATSIVGILAGRAVDKIGARIPTILGSVGMVFVALGLSTVIGSSIASVSIAVGFLGASYALLNTPIAASIASAVEPKMAATALSLNAMVFFVGGSFGTTICLALADARKHTEPLNPIYVGDSPGFSDAFLFFVFPMLLALALAFILPGRKALHSKTKENYDLSRSRN